MAFYYILQALDLPAGSEIIFPALTFWVVPELASVAGLKVVFADVDPRTFTIEPKSVERMITDEDARDRADAPVRPRVRHGRDPGDRRASQFDRARGLRARARRDVQGEGRRHVRHRRAFQLSNTQAAQLLRRRRGAACRTPRSPQRCAASSTRCPGRRRSACGTGCSSGGCSGFSSSLGCFRSRFFPCCGCRHSLDANPDVFLWEKIRSLHPLPEEYTERFPNVQAAIGLEALKRLDGWTARRAPTPLHEPCARRTPGVQVPLVPPDRTHVYYQYCVYGPERSIAIELVVRCVRRGIDIETLHVDVPPDMELFADAKAEAEGARRAAQAIRTRLFGAERRSGRSRRRHAWARDACVDARRQ